MLRLFANIIVGGSPTIHEFWRPCGIFCEKNRAFEHRELYCAFQEGLSMPDSFCTVSSVSVRVFAASSRLCFWDCCETNRVSAAGLFFAGMTAAQIPSQLVAVKVGFTNWLTLLSVAWGVMCACQAAVKSVNAFYVLRVLQGVTEAGVFPGQSIFDLDSYAALLSLSARTKAQLFWQAP